MPQSTNNSANHLQANPNYIELMRFLIQPFLESPDSLSVDCEIFPSAARVWLRIAFEGEDKGRVFGRGGRNIQAIRTVLTAVAASAGYSVYLDIFGGQGTPAYDDAAAEDQVAPTTPRRSVASPKLAVKPPPASMQ